MPKTIFYLLILGMHSILYGQLEVEKRIEFEIDEKSHYGIEFFDEDFILYHGSKLISETKSTWLLKVFGRDLEAVGEYKFFLSEKFRLINVDYDQGDLFIMFAINNYWEETDLKLYVINIESKKSRFMRFIGPELNAGERFTYSSFFVDDNSLIMDLFLSKGMGFNGCAAIYIYEQGMRKGKVIRTDNKSIGVKISANVKTDRDQELNEYLLCVAGVVKGSNPKRYYTFRYDDQGELISVLDVSAIEQKNGNTATFSSSHYMEDGTYTNITTFVNGNSKKNKLPGLPFIRKSDGFRVSKFDGEHEIFNIQIDYDQLESLKEGVMGPYTIYEDNDQGGICSVADILSHDVIQGGDRNYYLTEYYLPIMNTSSEGFEYIVGYSFYGGLLICFTDSGEILWDQVIAMSERLRSDQIEEQILFYYNEEKGKLNLSYSDGYSIHVVTYNRRGEIVYEKSFSYESNQNYSTKNWGENSVIVYGWEAAKSRKEKDKFFIQKFR